MCQGLVESAKQAVAGAAQVGPRWTRCVALLGAGGNAVGSQQTARATSLPVASLNQGNPLRSTPSLAERQGRCGPVMNEASHTRSREAHATHAPRLQDALSVRHLPCSFLRHSRALCDAPSCKVCVLKTEGEAASVRSNRLRKLEATARSTDWMECYKRYTGENWRAARGWPACWPSVPAGPATAPSLRLSAAAPPLPLPAAIPCGLLPLSGCICIVPWPRARGVRRAAAGRQGIAMRVQRVEQIGGQVGDGHILLKPRIHGLDAHGISSCGEGGEARR